MPVPMLPAPARTLDKVDLHHQMAAQKGNIQFFSFVFPMFPIAS